MKELSSWLITFFIIAFWLFRVIVAVTGSMGTDVIVQPMNLTTEIILSFIVIILVPFIFKRKIIAGLIYLVAYGYYFGTDLFAKFMMIMDGQSLGPVEYMALIVNIVGIILPLACVFDILLDKYRMKNPVNKQTDWFYKDEAYDRKLDERADKNQYKTL